MFPESQDFQALLSETGIEFSPPPGFAPCPVRENSIFHYQYGARSPSGDLEVRYRVDSFTRLEAERKVANAGMEALAGVRLDQMYSANFMAILFNLSGGAFAEPSVFKPETSTLLFSADWSALGFMRLASNDFAPDYDSAYVSALHKDGLADVYDIGLYNDISGQSERFEKSKLPQVVMSNITPTLRFT